MPQIEVGPALLGRVLNAQGIPIDGGRRLILQRLCLSMARCARP